MLVLIAIILVGYGIYLMFTNRDHVVLGAVLAMLGAVLLGFTASIY